MRTSRIAKANKYQRRAIKSLWERARQWDRPTTLTYREFRKTVYEGWGCLMVTWGGMTVGIELDGYTHS